MIVQTHVYKHALTLRICPCERLCMPDCLICSPRAKNTPLVLLLPVFERESVCVSRHSYKIHLRAAQLFTCHFKGSPSSVARADYRIKMLP